MKEVRINTTQTDLVFQYDTIGTIEAKASRKDHVRKAAGMAAATVVYAGLLMTENDFAIVLKAMLSILVVLGWLVYIIYYLWYFIKLFQKKQMIKKFIEEKIRDPSECYLSYDSEKIIIRTENLKSEINWQHFVAYYITGNSIFLFPKGDIYSAWSFSESEIGREHVDSIKQIARDKITPLMLENKIH